MKKKKYKLKIDGFLYLAFIIVVIVLIFKGINAYKTYKYHKTTEYKLITAGYTDKEIKLLDKYLDEKELLALSSKKKDKKLITLMSNQHYLHKHYNDYLEYISLNPNKEIDDVVKTINLHLNYAFYEDTTPTDTSKEYLILVNKYNYLGEDFKPDDLVTISTKYSWGNYGTHTIRKEVFDAFLKMHEDANQNGIYLMINSSYRDFNSQTIVYNNYLKRHGEPYADKYAARPGFSEHQTGLALDIFSIEGALRDTFKDSSAYLWLKDNAYKYGFILRYPEGKENITGFSFEPWHYRYVGVDAAKYIYENQITFEEYYVYNIENKK
ncbi:MAG: M15 family metallopeptidase [Bacilli bacterium]|nr:M15 family metallopeptidase [Bacilli bacterium]